MGTLALSSLALRMKHINECLHLLNQMGFACFHMLLKSHGKHHYYHWPKYEWWICYSWSIYHHPSPPQNDWKMKLQSKAKDHTIDLWWLFCATPGQQSSQGTDPIAPAPHEYGELISYTPHLARAASHEPHNSVGCWATQIALLSTWTNASETPAWLLHVKQSRGWDQLTCNQCPCLAGLCQYSSTNFPENLQQRECNNPDI